MGIDETTSRQSVRSIGAADRSTKPSEICSPSIANLSTSPRIRRCSTVPRPCSPVSCGRAGEPQHNSARRCLPGLFHLPSADEARSLQAQPHKCTLLNMDSPAGGEGHGMLLIMGAIAAGGLTVFFVWYRSAFATRRRKDLQRRERQLGERLDYLSDNELD